MTPQSDQATRRLIPRDPALLAEVGVEIDRRNWHANGRRRVGVIIIAG